MQTHSRWHRTFRGLERFWGTRAWPAPGWCSCGPPTKSWSASPTRPCSAWIARSHAGAAVWRVTTFFFSRIHHFDSRRENFESIYNLVKLQAFHRIIFCPFSQHTYQQWDIPACGFLDCSLRIWPAWRNSPTGRTSLADSRSHRSGSRPSLAGRTNAKSSTHLLSSILIWLKS